MLEKALVTELFELIKEWNHLMLNCQYESADKLLVEIQMREQALREVRKDGSRA